MSDQKKTDFSNVQSGVSSTENIVSPAPEPVQTYTIQKGDTLSSIAQKHYGKANVWKRIFEANRDVIDNPDKIFPGQVIKLPDID
ncbi:MAG: LysM peptidoglycan-binding domain-containing protein [Xanthomonadaceae bacterium]|nr:LysM peptidoglycan-binding domain-containing protein [Xanthomonadaceae bacterium]